MDIGVFEIFGNLHFEGIYMIFSLVALVLGGLFTWVSICEVFYALFETNYDIKEEEMEIEEQVITEHYMVLVNSDAVVEPSYHHWFNVSQDWDRWENYGRPLSLTV